MAIQAAVILLAVQGLVKLGTAARDAYEQLVRDRAIRLPSLQPVAFDPLASAEAFFKQNRTLIQPGGRFAELWSAPADRAAAGKEVLLVAAWQDSRPAIPDTEKLDAILVAQWAEGEGPPPPALRIALALAGVVLDFAALAPGIVRTGSAGNAVLEAVAAVAARTSILLPDLDDPEHWKTNNSLGGLVEGLLASLLRAGLQVAAEEPRKLVKAPHLAAVLGGAAKPLALAFDGALKERDWSRLIRLERFRDELLPAVAQGALAAVIANRDAFLGDLTAPGPSAGTESQAVAVVVNALLDQVATLQQAPGGFSLNDLATAESLKRFAQAAAGALASHPDLLFAADGPRTQAIEKMIAGVLAKAAKAERLDRALLLDVAGGAITDLRAVLPLYLRGGAWEAAASDVLDHALAGVAQGLAGDPKRIFQVLTGREQLVQMVGLVLARIAATPRMVTGKGAGAEVEAVVAAVAGAMAGAGADLLRPEGWLAVAAAAAEAAARNPGRLFKLGDGAAAAPAAQLIRLVLEVAESEFQEARAAGAPLVVGPLLEHILVTLLGVLADRVALAKEDLPRLRLLLTRLIDQQAGDKGVLRASEVRSLLAALAHAVLDGRLADPAAATSAELLKLAREG